MRKKIEQMFADAIDPVLTNLKETPDIRGCLAFRALGFGVHARDPVYFLGH